MRSRISDGKSRRRNGFDGTRCLGAGFSRTRSSSSKNSARCDFLSRMVEGERFQVPRLVARGNEVYRKQNVHGTELRIGHGFHSSHGLVVSALIEDWHSLESSLVISRSLEIKPFALGWDLNKLNKLEAKGNVTHVRSYSIRGCLRCGSWKWELEEEPSLVSPANTTRHA